MAINRRRDAKAGEKPRCRGARPKKNGKAEPLLTENNIEGSVMMRRSVFRMFVKLFTPKMMASILVNGLTFEESLIFFFDGLFPGLQLAQSIINAFAGLKGKSCTSKEVAAIRARKTLVSLFKSPASLMDQPDLLFKKVVASCKTIFGQKEFELLQNVRYHYKKAHMEDFLRIPLFNRLFVLAAPFIMKVGYTECERRRENRGSN